MKLRVIPIASAILVVACLAIVGCGTSLTSGGEDRQTPSTYSKEVLATLCPTATSSTTAPPETSTTTESPLERYADRLVSPATIGEPALAHVVAGLLGREVPVIGAEVVSKSPLKIAITVPGDDEGADVFFALPQLEREAAAEWLRSRELSEFGLRIEKPNGESQLSMSAPLPAGLNITPDVVAAPTRDLEASRQSLQDMIPPVLPAPVQLVGLELNDDVMHVRLLHVTLLVPDFPNQVDAYETANNAINSLADDLTKRRGAGIAVVWIDAVNAQGGIWVRSWSDRQLNSSSGHNILAKDYLPSNWSRPATTSTTESPKGTTTTAALDSGITGTVTLGPVSPVEQQGVPNDKPYSATIVIKDASGTAVARVQSGADGRFTVRLPPGNYTLEPVNGNPLPRAGSQDVTVTAHTFTQVTISYDTGIR